MKRLIIKLFLLAVLITAAIVGYYVYRGWETYQAAVSDLPIEAAAEPYQTCSDCLAFSDIDEDFVDAVVSIEDKRYFVREGFDWIAFARAMIANLRAKQAVEGGSTISQQIAKNLYYQSVSRGIDEKIAEVFIMSRLEDIYSKEDLFAIYANMNYYGDGFWGLQQASRGYYQTDGNNLTVAQAAILAGIPNLPAVYQLSTGHDAAVERQRRVLSAMLKNEYITQEEYELALQENV